MKKSKKCHQLRVPLLHGAYPERLYDKRRDYKTVHFITSYSIMLEDSPQYVLLSASTVVTIIIIITDRNIHSNRHCIVLYCIVVGSRRLIPPDALQPKAYCTNPGVQSFLIAPPGVSNRDPSSERRNYLGEKWPMNFACPTST